MKPFKSAYEYLNKFPVKGYKTNEPQSIPDVDIVGKRPVKPMSLSEVAKPATRRGVSGWTYHPGQEKWVSTVDRDKKTGKPTILTDEEYNKRFPGQFQISK